MTTPSPQTPQQPAANYPACPFNPTAYSSFYPDLAKALGTDANALKNHYITYGINEGRTPCGEINIGCQFNPLVYGGMYSDLAQEYGTNANALKNHYMTYGINEGRNVCPSPNTSPPQTISLSQSGLKLNTSYQFKPSSCLNLNTPPGPLGSTCNPNPLNVIQSNSNPNAVRLAYTQNPTANPANCLGIYQGSIISNSDCESITSSAQIADFLLVNGNEANTISFYNPQTQMTITPTGPLPVLSTSTSRDYINPTIVSTPPPSAIQDWDQALQQANALQQQDLVNGEIFQIVTDPVKNECISIDTNNSVSGRTTLPLTTATCNASDLKQNFQYIPDPSNQGGNQIKNLYNNTCMNVLDQGSMSSLNDGSPIVMYECEQNPQYNNRFSTSADNTQPTPITTYANKCVDTTGTNGSVVQNSCVFGKQGQYFQYQRVNPTSQTPVNIILNNDTQMINQQTATMLNNAANVPATNNNANIQKYLEQQAADAKKSQNSLLDMAKKSYHKLLQTKKKMYPMAGKSKLASQSPQFATTETFDNRALNPYRFSAENETGLINEIEMTNNKILLIMKTIQRKNIIIALVSLGLLSLVYSVVIFMLYKKNAISKITTLILFVLLLLYVSYRVYNIFYDPAVLLNTMAEDANKIRERVCADI